jgi:hypothetical protein
LGQEAANWFPGTAHFGTIGDAPPEVVEAGLKKLEEDYRSQNRDDCRNAIADFLALAGRLDVKVPKKRPRSDELAIFVIAASPTPYSTKSPKRHRDTLI